MCCCIVILFVCVVLLCVLFEPFKVMLLSWCGVQEITRLLGGVVVVELSTRLSASCG